MHLATAFQLAGYRHVIATLWPIADRAAPRIAADFYRRLGDGVAIRPVTIAGKTATYTIVVFVASLRAITSMARIAVHG